MRFLSLAEVLQLHATLIAFSGGAAGVRDLGRVQSALAQPQATFDGVELHPTLVEKAGTLAFALVQGHAFVDGVHEQLGQVIAYSRANEIVLAWSR